MQKAGLNYLFLTRRSLIKEGKRFSFPRKERLKKKEEIRGVFMQKKAVSCSGAKLFMRKNRLLINRIAFTFPRKFGNAVERNASRRISREVYRLLKNEFRNDNCSVSGYDFVLLVYNNHDCFSTRMAQLRQLFSLAGLYGSSGCLDLPRK